MLEFRGDRRGVVMGELLQNDPCYYSQIICCCYTTVSDSIQLASVHDAARTRGDFSQVQRESILPAPRDSP
jgi:hypothetical protein